MPAQATLRLFVNGACRGTYPDYPREQLPGIVKLIQTEVRKRMTTERVVLVGDAEGVTHILWRHSWSS